jgi:hypothetical protein
MSVDTKGCVVTECKDAFQVVGILQDWWNKVLKDNGIGIKDFWKEEKQWSSLKLEISSYGLLRVHFLYNGEERMLNVSFYSDCDLKLHEEIQGHKCLWLSLGNWGSSVELMTSLLQVFKTIGVCYIDENDCDDICYQEIK